MTDGEREIMAELNRDAMPDADGEDSEDEALRDELNREFDMLRQGQAHHESFPDPPTDPNEPPF